MTTNRILIDYRCWDDDGGEINIRAPREDSAVMRYAEMVAADSPQQYGHERMMAVHVQAEGAAHHTYEVPLSFSVSAGVPTKIA